MIVEILIFIIILYIYIFPCVFFFMRWRSTRGLIIVGHGVDKQKGVNNPSGLGCNKQPSSSSLLPIDAVESPFVVRRKCNMEGRCGVLSAIQVTIAAS